MDQYVGDFILGSGVLDQGRRDCDQGNKDGLMTKYDFIWARRVTLNNVQLALISLLVNFSYELEKIISRYDFLWAKRVILTNDGTDSNLT